MPWVINVSTPELDIIVQNLAPKSCKPRLGRSCSSPCRWSRRWCSGHRGTPARSWWSTPSRTPSCSWSGARTCTDGCRWCCTRCCRPCRRWSCTWDRSWRERRRRGRRRGDRGRKPRTPGMCLTRANCFKSKVTF